MKKLNRLLLTAVSVGAGFASCVCAQVPNPWLDNPGFERGELAWSSWGDGDLRDEYYGLMAKTGNQFLRLWSRSGWYQDFPTGKGDKYQISAFVSTAKDDALWGDAFGELKVEWRNKQDGDEEIGNAKSVKFDIEGHYDKKISPDEWTEIVMPVVRAPRNATHCRVLVTIYTEGGEKGGGCALFDDLSVTEFGRR